MSLEVAPIVLFVYNRPWHTEQTLEALAKNRLAEKSYLTIYADGLKSSATEEDKKRVGKVRELIRSKQWCKEVKIVEREKNWGLADSIVDGVTNAVNEHGKVIVLEDDIVTSPGFLQYMNDALRLYQGEDKVMHVSGYMIPLVAEGLPETFFYNQTSCWGWATWKRAWNAFQPDAVFLRQELDNKDSVYHFNLNGYYDFYSDLVRNINNEIKTWAIKWHTSVYLKGGLCLHPKTSLVSNIGFDGTGVHCGKSDKFKTSITEHLKVEAVKSLSENIEVRDRVVNFYKNQRQSITSYTKAKSKVWLTLRLLAKKLFLKKIFLSNG